MVAAVFGEQNSDAAFVIASLRPAPEAAALQQHAPQQSLNALTAAAEHEETAAPPRIIAVMDGQERNPLVHPNTFAEAPKEHDDHAEPRDAFPGLTSKITIGPKPSQSLGKRRRIPNLAPRKIRAIVKAIEEGNISLPDVDRPSNEDYIAMWSLVDSGSSTHAMHAQQIIPNAPVEPPPKGRQGG